MAAAMSLCALGALSGCSQSTSINFMQGIEGSGISEEELVISCDSDPYLSYSDGAVDFSLRLLRASREPGKNTVISPISVLYTLALVSNGADGETLAQLESALCADIDVLNAFLKTYYKKLGSSDKTKLALASSIWFKDDENFTVSSDFLRTNADYFDAGIYKAAFDKSTLRDINRLIEEQTDGMIKNMLDEIPQDAVMYLINAVSFDAQWASIYNKSSISSGIFTTADGEQLNAEFMYSSEYNYLSDQYATGFIKLYHGGRYAFAALLPNEGISVDEYLALIDGESLHRTLLSAQDIEVNAGLVKFKSDYDGILNDSLSKLGIVDAFSETAADFSRLGSVSSDDSNIFISRFLHRSFITVDERGTKAGAASIAEASNDATMAPEDGAAEIKVVILDRPFIYMVIDTEDRLPIFLGIIENLTEE